VLIPESNRKSYIVCSRSFLPNSFWETKILIWR